MTGAATAENARRPRQGPYRDRTRIMYDCMISIMEAPRYQTQLMALNNLSWQVLVPMVADFLEYELAYLDHHNRLVATPKGQKWVQKMAEVYTLLPLYRAKQKRRPMSQQQQQQQQKAAADKKEDGKEV